jgi:cysteinyl-tRNA synthetase
MALKLTNTLGGKKVDFAPLTEGAVKIYSCGPTVKEPINLGKFRSFLLADLLRRSLELAGYEVRHVMNITDVGHLNEFEEDVVEIAAARSGMYPWELVQQEEKRFHQDRAALHVLDCHEYPHARDHVDEMIEVIRGLEAKGLTYQAGGNIYLDLDKVKGFGQLAGTTAAKLAERLEASRTPAHPEKRNILDIDLWRTDVAHTAHWRSPWGRGFPGWHVECVAMSRKYLGETFDVHTGSHENVFPHHECEIAQAESLSGKTLARFWLHSGPVHVDGKPMTLENNNVATVRELLESGFRGVVLRVALLSAPYREAVDFGKDVRELARDQVNAILGFHEYLTTEAPGAPATEGPAAGDPPEWIDATDREFRAALEDDLDYPRALRTVAEQVASLEPETCGATEHALEALKRWDQVLGILE